VSTCPASARHFGDLGDPNSEVSQMVDARGGYDLMPEMDMKPTNKYLPPRPRPTSNAPTTTPSAAVASGGTGSRFLDWVDQTLSR
jgi:Fe-S-cluster-containing dehydrogenase component